MKCPEITSLMIWCYINNTEVNWLQWILVLWNSLYVAHVSCVHFSRLYRLRQKPGHACSGHQCQPTLPGCVRVWWEGHHHGVRPAARAGQEEEGSDCRRPACSGVCLHGFLPWFQVPNRPDRWSRVDPDLLALGKTESPGNSEDQQHK